MLDFEELEARRAARRRRRIVRRRRRRALGALAFVALTTGVVAGAGSGSGPRRDQAAHRAAGAPAPHHHHHHRHPLPQRTGLAAGAGPEATVPILMYHVIAGPQPTSPFPGLYVTPTLFEAQMGALYRAGWTAVTMDQLWDAWTGKARLPDGRPVVVSFDNGYSSQYNAAYPVLRHLHWPGVLNIQLTGLPRAEGGLSGKAIRRLVAAGWELDTQGESHADLVALDAAGLRHEVVDARRIIRRRYGVPANWFCYPAGHYDPAVIDTVRAAGYRGATTVVPGLAHRRDDPYRLPRLRVLGGTTPAQLLEQIAAARHHVPAPVAYGIP